MGGVSGTSDPMPIDAAPWSMAGWTPLLSMPFRVRCAACDHLAEIADDANAGGACGGVPALRVGAAERPRGDGGGIVPIRRLTAADAPEGDPFSPMVTGATAALAWRLWISDTATGERGPVSE